MGKEPAQRVIGVALLGCGVVGTGVAQILRQQRELIRRRTGLVFDIRHVVVRDPKKHRPGLEGLHFTDDAVEAINDPATSVVVELVGGIKPAGLFVERALRLGKPVVTANKSLLSESGPELFALARKQHTCIGFEASCAGGIPIINALIHGFAANRIDALVGIVNGTCNYILTRMTRNGLTYERALAEAQEAGFAEADPKLDVSGRDAAQKLALLATLAFNARVTEKDIHIEGIDELREADLKFAGELGYVVKLLAIAEREQDQVSLRVHPTLVHRNDLLAEVSGSFNAVSVYGDAVGHALFYGRGAGRQPTASAVVSDLIQVGLGLTALAFRQLNLLPDGNSAIKLLPFADLRSRYYLRLLARDEPGVLAQVTKVLGNHRISLSAILQHESSEGQYVPVVITTHRAREGDIQKALRGLNRLTTLKPPAVCLRIIDPPKEFAGNGN
ncbi:MAG TPA: homoserine dehydrogenase [Tepidisphaeraceae bacterium]|nr:homoserine dehydrogenase [Tepidisphaeraceae bacterium]